MKHPLVSIITPSFNRAAFIGETIRSVAAQTYGHIEYLVMDGGSSDGTVDILEAHARKGELRYVSEPDRGMYEAINKGLARCKGDVLCYINTDDRFFPWSIAAAVRFFAINDAIDIVYGDTLVHDLDAGQRNVNILPNFSSLWLRSGGIIPQPTVFLRRRVYNTLGGFQQDVKYLADCEYWLRADRAGMRFKKIHEVLAIETNHSGTIRQTLTQEVENEKRRLQEIYSSPLLRHIFLRTLLHRAKYMEKEMLMLLFLGVCKGLGGNKGWPRFRRRFDIGVDIRQYYADKLLRTKSNLWRLEERHG